MNNCLYNLIIILFLLAIFNKTNGKETFAETAAVRCCKGDSDDKITMAEKWGGYGCNDNKTFDDAKVLCNNAGFNLCKGSKLKTQKGSGCGFDKKQIWIQGGKTCRGNDSNCQDVAAEPVQQQPEPVQQQSEPVSQPESVSQPGSLCKSIKISNPACKQKGYRGWDFLGNNIHKCKYNDPLDENLSNVGTLCDKEINENDDRIDIKKVINGKQKIEEDKDYVVLLLTSGSQQFLDIKKIKGSEIVNKGKLRNRDRRTFELVNFSPLMNEMSLEFFFEYEKKINGRKYFIGYSDLDRDFGNLQNLVILTDNLQVMNMNDNKIKDIFRELCNECKLIQWKKVGDNLYIDKYMPCGIDYFNINKIN